MNLLSLFLFLPKWLVGDIFPVAAPALTWLPHIWSSLRWPASPLITHQIWFIASVIVFVIAALLALYAWRVLRLQAQMRNLSAQVAQRNEELRQANTRLELEIAQRQRAEESLARRTEEELHVSEARFRAMFDSAAVGLGMLGLDRKILDANREMCRMLGQTHEELLGRTPDTATYPEDLAASAQLFEDLAAGRRDSYQTERRYVRKNGEVFWAHVTMSSVRGPDAQPRFLVGMVIDIDAQRQTQQKLRESEARFRAMFDHAAVGMALLTLDRRVLQSNQAAARITGYAIDELAAMVPADLALPEDRAIGQTAMAELIAGRRDACQIERRYVRPDGTVYWARVTFSGVPGPDGRPSYLMGMIEDIDEQRAARQKLETQEREYRQHLEEHVEARTSELSQANQQLQLEMEQRRRAEAALAQKAADEAVSAERTRLAHDLHDAVTQTLFSASLIAEVLPDLWQINPVEARASTDELRQLTRGALAEMRTLLLELRPAALTRARFGDLLKQLVEALVGRTRLPVALCVEGERDLPPEVQVALYRIAQESLNNVIKHARARQVAVHLALATAGVHLEISDDGMGFDLAAARLASLGLRIMRERAETIGAELNIDSKPGRGTCVSALWTDVERGD